MAGWGFGVALFILLASLGFAAPPDHDTWAVKIFGGIEHARAVVNASGGILLGPIGHLKDHYHVAKTHWRLIRMYNGLNDRSYGSQCRQQPRARPRRWVPQDQFFRQQWYMQDTEFSLAVQPVWAMNVTGGGVVITIVDDGLEYTNHDIIGNYDPTASYDFNDDDSDPMPRPSPDNINRHGTRCAGTAAAATNTICGAGVAFDAKVGGIRMLDEESVSDAVEASSLGFNAQHVDIYSCSWGPVDNGATLEGPGPLAKETLKQGVSVGRQGLGSIYSWASGNGGGSDDNCNCDGYTNSMYTIAIGSIDQLGESPYYGEVCAAMIGSTFSSGSGLQEVVAADIGDACTLSFTGTSASAPMAAGLFALALQANPCLSWRDLQHIAVHSADPTDLTANFPWVTTGAGLKFNHKFGFGLIRADRLVAAARAPSWVSLAGRIGVQIPLQTVNRPVAANHPVQLTATTTACDPTNVLCIASLEHVSVSLTISGGRRGDLSITLTSPAGSLSYLLTARKYDDDRTGMVWTFMTTMCWGENPSGTWVLTVSNAGGVAATLVEWGMELYGTAPLSVYNTSAEVAPVQLHGHLCSFCGPNSFPDGQGKCRACHSSCDEGCVAPGPSGCAENFGNLEIYNEDDGSDALSRRRVVFVVVCSALLLALLIYAAWPNLRRMCGAPAPALASMRYVPVMEGEDEYFEDGAIVQLPEQPSAYAPSSAHQSGTALTL